MAKFPKEWLEQPHLNTAPKIERKRGGARPGGGRKSAKDEVGLILKLKPYEQEVIDKMVEIMRSNHPKNFEAAKLLLAYIGGQPSTTANNTVTIETVTSIDLNNILDFGGGTSFDTSTIDTSFDDFEDL